MGRRSNRGMEIRVGINTEYARQSFTLTLEEPDILALLIEAVMGAPAGDERERAMSEVADLRFRLPTPQLKLLAENEAYLLLLPTQLSYQAINQQQHDQALAERMMTRQQAFSWVRRMAAVPEPPAPAA